MMGPDYDVVLDVGTSHVRACGPGRAFAEEPSLVRVPRTGAGCLGAGSAAEREPAGDRDSYTVWPLRQGAVVDVEAAGWLLAMMLRKVRPPSRPRPALLGCAPSDASEAEKGALREALRRAGAGPVDLVPEPLAAAVGAGLDIGSPFAQMVVDVGDGVTDVAVIREGRIELSTATRSGCRDARESLAREVARRNGVQLAWREAQRVIDAVGRAGEPDVLVGHGTTARGQRSAVRVPRTDILRAIEPVVAAVVSAVRRAWREVSPAASCEVIETGVCITGGGARLPGLVQELAASTLLDVRPAEAAEHAVIRGAGRIAWGRRAPVLG